MGVSLLRPVERTWAYSLKRPGAPGESVQWKRSGPHAFFQDASHRPPCSECPAFHGAEGRAGRASGAPTPSKSEDPSPSVRVHVISGLSLDVS